MTLAGAFFSKRARTSAHIVWGSLNEISGDFTEDLERDGYKSKSLSAADILFAGTLKSVVS
jgi:hypothetical protein